jgi:hypothetical protein
VTDMDRIRRHQDQLEAGRVLIELLQNGWHHDLPPLHWHLAAGACALTGTSTAPDPAQRRRDLSTWATALELSIVNDSSDGAAQAAGTRGPRGIVHLLIHSGQDTQP